MDVKNLSDKNLLETLMKENGWTQVRLAAEIGLKSQAQISKVINKKRSLGNVARKVAEMLYEQTINQ